MKSTGIIRRVDDLGRVVLPKEIRRMVGIDADDPVEIGLTDEKVIVIRRYWPVQEALQKKVFKTGLAELRKLYQTVSVVPMETSGYPSDGTVLPAEMVQETKDAILDSMARPYTKTKWPFRYQCGEKTASLVPIANGNEVVGFILVLGFTPKDVEAAEPAARLLASIVAEDGMY